MCLLLVVAVEQPALAAERTPSCAGDALTAADQTSALARAAECGKAVEIAAARGYAERQVAEPDGSITLESYLRPRWAKDSNGQWVEADPTLRRDPTGAISTVATVVDLEVSAGGRGALVRATDPAGGSILLTWPAELPEPVLAGATATYPDVLDGVDGVDLQVTAGVDSFSYALVVHSAEAAASPELATVEVGITGDGLSISQTPDGAVVALGATGEVVLSAAGAYMWDSSSPEPVAQLDSAVRDLAVDRPVRHRGPARIDDQLGHGPADRLPHRRV